MTEIKEVQKDRKPQFIIAIGASAGGLNAVSELVSQLPEDLDAAVLVVIHLSKVGLGEFLISRLQKYTTFTCIIPREGDEIEAGHIYIAPPDKHLAMKDGRTVLGYGPAENRWRPSIDVMFRSAAAHYGNRVIGIVLTGYLNDGTAGMLAVKRNNGYCIVQDPDQAEYPDMPKSVLGSMEVDFCVRLDKMGETIEEIIAQAKPEKNILHDDVSREAEIAEKTVTSIEAVSALGEKSLFVCPDCGGGLWNIDNNGTKRYRCHVGHAFTENDLLTKQGESLEATMWVALRIMEERKVLLMKISNDEINKGFNRLADSHLNQAHELEEHIKKMKELLFQTQKERVA